MDARRALFAAYCRGELDLREWYARATRREAMMSEAERAARLAAIEARLTALTETVEDLVTQFAYEGKRDGQPAYSTGGLSALEGAFAVLGWDDPHPAPERSCEHDDCSAWASCGTPTPDGYKRLCGEHYRAVAALAPPDAAAP